MSEPQMNSELRDFESSLQQLQPRTNSINRDAVMFRAGQESMRRTLKQWRLGALTSMAIVVGMGSWWFLQNPREPDIRIVQVPASEQNVPKPKETKPAAPPAPQQMRPNVLVARNESSRDFAYYRLQHDLLRWGFDGLPASPMPPASPAQNATLASMRKPRPMHNEQSSVFSSWLISIGDE